MKFQSYDADMNNIDALNKELDSGDHVFILVYMDGCMPCNNAKPHWYALKPTLKDQYNKRDDISVIDVERTHLPNMKEIGQVEGFPTIKYMNKKKGEKEDYEGSRTTDDFVKWIESKIDHVNSIKNDSIKSDSIKSDSIKSDSIKSDATSNSIKSDSIKNGTNKLKSELLESISNLEQNYNNIIKNSSLSGEKSSSNSKSTSKRSNSGKKSKKGKKRKKSKKDKKSRKKSKKVKKSKKNKEVSSLLK